MASEGSFVVPAGRRLSRVDSKTLRESFNGNASAEMEAVMRNLARKDDKIKYNRRMRVVLASAIGVMVIMVGAMFAVTLSANEASKEAHVTGGIMTNRLGSSAVKTDHVQSYGNILGFPCLPMTVLQRMDEVSLEIEVPASVATNGFLDVVMKVGTVERSSVDKFTTVTSPSDLHTLEVRNGMATYKDQSTCKNGCKVVVELDLDGRRLTKTRGQKIDRSLTAEPPKQLATYAVFNMFAKVYEMGCGAFQTVGAMCDVMPKDKKMGPIAKMCKSLGSVALDESVVCAWKPNSDKNDFNNAITFTMEEILNANDVFKAYADVGARCGDAKSAELYKVMVSKHGRRLFLPGMGHVGAGASNVVNRVGDGIKNTFDVTWETITAIDNFAWCSTNLGFISAKFVPGLNVADTANFCATTSPSTHNNEQGESVNWASAKISECCIDHDRCLQDDAAGRCTRMYEMSGGCCDDRLSACQENHATCSRTSYRTEYYGCGWWGRSRCSRRVAYNEYDYGCGSVSAIVKAAMGGVRPNKDHLKEFDHKTCPPWNQQKDFSHGWGQ